MATPTADVERIRHEIAQLVRADDTRHLRLLRDRLKSDVGRRALARRTTWHRDQEYAYAPNPS